MHQSFLLKSLGALCLAFVFSSCVAREHHDSVLTSAKLWQKKYLEADGQRTELAAENARLKAQMQVLEANPIEAGGSTAEIDRRLSDLRNVLAELGSAPGDVTKFAVDGGYVYRVKDAILFPLGSASLTEEGNKALNEIIVDIESQAHGSISVRGHTDNVPVSRPETKAKYPHGNLQLSAARAVEVAAAIVAQARNGALDITVTGYGESQPVAPNDSDSNRAKNRRVEIFVADPNGGQK